MQNHDIIILAHSDFIKIIRCGGCNKIKLIHKNYLLDFSIRSFKDFTQNLDPVQFENYKNRFPDGSYRFVMSSGVQGIQFVFSREEFELFKESLNQAYFMLNAMAVLEE